MSMYNKTPIKFSCLKCGQCCRTLLKENKGIITGLELTPSEAKKFPSNILHPRYGRGKTENSISKITTYQISTDICPHLGNGACKIYNERPLSCRRFPLMHSSENITNVALGKDCSFIENLETKLGYKLNYLFSRSTFIDYNCWDALTTNNRLMEIDDIDSQLEGMNIFEFNLKNMKWLKI